MLRRDVQLFDRVRAAHSSRRSEGASRRITACSGLASSSRNALSNCCCLTRCTTTEAGSSSRAGKLRMSGWACAAWHAGGGQQVQSEGVEFGLLHAPDGLHRLPDPGWHIEMSLLARILAPPCFAALAFIHDCRHTSSCTRATSKMRRSCCCGDRCSPRRPPPDRRTTRPCRCFR